MESAVARVADAATNGSATTAPSVDAAFPERVTRPVEIPPARRPDAAQLATLAAVAALAAVALGALLVVRLAGDGSRDGAVAGEEGRTIALLARPGTERIPLERTAGSIVLAVASDDGAVLVLDGLAPAPEGKAYQAWVAGPDSTIPAPAALFSGEQRVVPLSRAVPPGASVGVTVEDAVGADTPGQRLRMVARRGP